MTDDPTAAAEQQRLTEARAGYAALAPTPLERTEALDDDIKMDANELVDCRWFSKDECASMLMRKHPQGLTCPPHVELLKIE